MTHPTPRILRSVARLAAVLCALAPGAALAQAPADHVPGRVLVRFAPPQTGCTLELPLCWPEAMALLEAEGLLETAPLHEPKLAQTPRRDLPHPETPLHRTWRFELAPATDLGPLLKALREASGVEIASPDWIGQGAAPPPPDDPFFAEQWAAEQPNDADIDLLEAWRFTAGYPRVVIAVLDTGLDTAHRDFAPQRIVPGYDFVNRDMDPADDLGHGTHVAGIATAGADDGAGIAGICPGCSLMPVKVLDHENLGTYSWWIAGITYAVDNGAHVINLSAGGLKNDPLLRDAVRYAVDNHVTVVAAMMNFDNDQAFYPAAWPEVVAVGATDRDDLRASPFGFGGGSNYGPHIELVAPGADIFGSLVRSPDGALALSGTSQATPMVSGTVGLLLSLDATLEVEAVRAILAASAQDQRGRPDEDTPGFDPYHGWGRLNVANAVRTLVTPDDIDGDGFLRDVDCDDTSDTTWPGAPELRNGGRDDDCDPTTDDPVEPEPEPEPEPAADTAPDAGLEDIVAGGGVGGDPGTGCCTTVKVAPAGPPLTALGLAALGLTLFGLRRRRRRCCGAAPAPAPRARPARADTPTGRG